MSPLRPISSRLTPATMAGTDAAAKNDEYAIQLIRQVCELAGDFEYIRNTREELRLRGVHDAVKNHDSRAIFDWLMDAASYQGVSNRTATTYVQQHGQVTWADISRALSSSGFCPKLRGYWLFNECSYEKNKKVCAAPRLLTRCPLPRHDLRNGRLNQTAYGLFFFIRDVADGNLVAWIDERLQPTHEILDLRECLLEPMRCIFGISDKVLNMALSTLLIGARRPGSIWFETGCRMVAIDTLVHNFLHRTGILRRLDAEHSYGPLCYATGCCEQIITRISSSIDASQFNREFPRDFPRFVQYAIWRFCARFEWNVCNSLRVRDGRRCKNEWCRLYQICDRLVLRPNKTTTKRR
jgi:hypothetical protein